MDLVKITFYYSLKMLLISNKDKNAKDLESSPIQKKLSEFLQSTGIKAPYRLKGNTELI